MKPISNTATVFSSIVCGLTDQLFMYSSISDFSGEVRWEVMMEEGCGASQEM